MEKRKNNKLGVELAERASGKGASPDQDIPNAEVKGVRPYRAIGVFPDAKGPVHSDKGFPYRGTSTWQKPQSDSTGQEGDDLTSAK